MLIAIMSDIHANREALDACLADAAASGAQRYVFLGDVVGYGADPAYCVDIVAAHVQRGATAVKGNHDAALLDIEMADMNPIAETALVWTLEHLDPTQLRFLASLPMQQRDGEVLYVHADASAPERWIYIASPDDARRSLAATDATWTFCGHVHQPQRYGIERKRRVVVQYRVDGEFHLSPNSRWLTVLGAAGQPRDGDPRACYGLLDDAAGSFVMRRLRYDIGAAAAKIIDAGLPGILAARLGLGR